MIKMNFAPTNNLKHILLKICSKFRLLNDLKVGKLSTVVLLIIIASTARAQGPAWAWEAGKITNNGSVQVKSSNGTSTYNAVKNPTGSSAKINQSAVTQPPVVIVNSTTAPYDGYYFAESWQLVVTNATAEQGKNRDMWGNPSYYGVVARSAAICIFPVICQSTISRGYGYGPTERGAGYTLQPGWDFPSQVGLLTAGGAIPTGGRLILFLGESCTGAVGSETQVTVGNHFDYDESNGIPILSSSLGLVLVASGGRSALSASTPVPPAKSTLYTGKVYCRDTPDSIVQKAIASGAGELQTSWNYKLKVVDFKF